MHFKATRIPYRQTNAFSGLALDYIDQKESLKDFFAFPPNLAGIQAAIKKRQEFPTDRKLLVAELEKQYKHMETSGQVKKNLQALLSENCFTITTAHQNNLFLGPLYFIYKIMHVIRAADALAKLLPAYKFVPVFYIGTEDADLEELNHIYIGNEKLNWPTKQSGAVGRMTIDKDLVKLISALEGQLTVLPYGKELVKDLKKFYVSGHTIQQATFELVNHLFAEYGLVVLLPDNPSLKASMIPVFEDELIHQRSHGLVEKTTIKLSDAGYKNQAHARDINLFYLKDNTRERITIKDDQYTVNEKGIHFTREEILTELRSFPERFSPNVILRGIYQETILPDIVFTGGAGEIAYWLQYMDLFEYYKVPYPVLLLRNSFLLLEKKWQQKIARSGFDIEDFFKDENELAGMQAIRRSANQLRLENPLRETENIYRAIKKQIESIDVTLEKHVEALKQKTLHRLQELEKKMLRAEKRKFTDSNRQIHSIKEKLFPGGGLQERHDNFAYYYALWGKDLFRQLYEHSPFLEQEFVILSEA
jgi:bacillithiol synthase